MKHGRSTCINYGRCQQAGLTVANGARPGSPCPECGEALMECQGKTVKPLLYGGISIIIIAAVLLYAWMARLPTVRDRFASSPNAGMISAQERDDLEIASYFTNESIRPLLTSAFSGDVEKVTQLLARNPDLIKATGKGGITPLHATLFSNTASGFETLQSAGFDPNVAADNGITPLMAAAMHPNSQFLRAALRENSSPHTQNDYKGRNALLLSVANRQTANTAILLQYGADPNSVDRHGSTALITAFQGRRPDPALVKLLINAGAEPAVTDHTGLNARDYAMTFDDPGILALLP